MTAPSPDEESIAQHVASLLEEAIKRRPSEIGCLVAPTALFGTAIACMTVLDWGFWASAGAGVGASFLAFMFWGIGMERAERWAELTFHRTYLPGDPRRPMALEALQRFKRAGNGQVSQQAAKLLKRVTGAEDVLPPESQTPEHVFDIPKEPAPVVTPAADPTKFPGLGNYSGPGGAWLQNQSGTTSGTQSGSGSQGTTTHDVPSGILPLEMEDDPPKR